jgi:hypothetical protein
MSMRALVFLVAVTACGDEPFDGLLKPPSGSDGIQLDVKLMVQPGEENTVCKNFAMPEGAFDIGRFESAMTPVSHHLLVYNLTLPADQVTDDIIDHCDENRDIQSSRIGILYGTQSVDSSLDLPSGIAFPARGGLAVQLEYHVLNTSDQPVDAEAALNMWRSQGTITGEAGMLFFYHTRIAIAPQSRASARMRAAIANDVELMMLVPHMHSRGVAMQAFHDTGSGSPEPLFSVQGWENPNQTFTPAVHLAANDIVDFHCDYDNLTPDWIFDGFSARHDEMCVTGGVYYRPGGDRLPLQDEVNFGRGVVYSGTSSCGQIESCMEAIDWSNWNASPQPGNQLDVCVLGGCQSAGDAFSRYNPCRYNMCQASCYTLASDGRIVGLRFGDPACVSCVDVNCAAARDACANATCP